MTQLLVALLLFALPGFFLVGLAADAWNDHDRAGAVAYAALVIVGTLLFQGCWDAAGGVV